MTLRFLLDTTIVSAPVSKVPNRAVVRRLEERAHLCAIAAPVWHELTHGCACLPRGRRRDGLEDYLETVVRASFPILPYDEVAARLHGVERARMRSSGVAVPYVDGQIAAIARSNELVLVTLNVRDFGRFAGLEVEDWSKARR